MHVYTGPVLEDNDYDDTGDDDDDDDDDDNDERIIEQSESY